MPSGHLLPAMVALDAPDVQEELESARPFGLRRTHKAWGWRDRTSAEGAEAYEEADQGGTDQAQT
eukprot:2206849-Amphidinium_carterae.2